MYQVFPHVFHFKDLNFELKFLSTHDEPILCVKSNGNGEEKKRFIIDQICPFVQLMFFHAFMLMFSLEGFSFSFSSIFLY
jgi:hypothetical protein